MSSTELLLVTRDLVLIIVGGSIVLANLVIIGLFIRTQLDKRDNKQLFNKLYSEALVEEADRCLANILQVPEDNTYDTGISNEVAITTSRTNNRYKNKMLLQHPIHFLMSLNKKQKQKVSEKPRDYFLMKYMYYRTI